MTNTTFVRFKPSLNLIAKKLHYGLKFALIIITLSGLMGCEQVAHASPITQFSTSQARKDQLWDRMRKNFKLQKTSLFKQNTNKAANNPRVARHLQQYRKNKQQVTKLAKASPYLFYIVEELERRKMPGELALLPMLESNFEPKATSRRGAAGLWQFIPGTGRKFGLKQDASYDGRRDITASTHAALNYLQVLHSNFQSWELALAAYNAGEGAVSRAIKRNQKLGMPTNYWNLELSRETTEYVPKLLALAEIVNTPQQNAAPLPAIENRPYFTSVNPGKAITLNKVAKLAQMDVKEVKLLNPGYKQATTPAKGPQQLLLPLGNAAKFLENLKLNLK